MNTAGTVHCFNCLQPVLVDEVDVDGVCAHCNELKTRTGLDNEGQPLGADAGIHVEGLRHYSPLLDERSFDGGDTLASCDEI